ncbi:MAG: MBL fold metallo-hydrolase [Clostridiales bacterium]|nr:MBL fold metallo-hydrolase [Clostridiales bacterium]
MGIVCIDSGMLQSNVYIIKNGNECVLIDAGCSAADILKELSCKEQVKYIILTHGHVDHICSADEIRKETGAKVVAYKDEESLLKNANYNCSYYICGRPYSICPDILVSEDDVIKLGEDIFSFIYTPGHTSGSMCVKYKNVIFTGDTLFKGSVGRCDFPTGDEEDLIYSVKKKLYILEDDMVVYPGHGDVTTIGWEKKNNIIGD